MNWDALGSIAELFGAIAVFLTLAYLAVQVRQSSRVTEAATSHSITRSRNELNIAVASNPQLAELMMRGGLDYTQLSLAEQIQFDALMYAMLNVYEDLFVQNNKGFATPGQYESMGEFILGLFGSDSMKQWWERKKSAMTPEFQAEIDGLLRISKS